MIVKNHVLIAPKSAKISKTDIVLGFDEYDVKLSVNYRKNGSLKLTVTDISDEVDGFVFGAYCCPEATKFGEVIGAAWNDDGSVVCIQSLNPKTVGELNQTFSNDTEFPSPSSLAAGISSGKTVLACSAENMTRPRLVKKLFGCEFQNVIAEPVSLPDGSIVGASVILTYAKSADELLCDISNIEIEEHLPHPTIDGEWTKTSSRTKDIYFVFSGGNAETQITMAEKAGVSGIYFSDPFTSWGHFEINPKLYPGGEKEFAESIRKARDRGVNVGFHTLSNFIHTKDPYVTPVPHKELLTYDPTPITKAITEDDTEITIQDELNYSMHITLGAVRIEDEIIQFKTFDSATKTLQQCKRGAFGTVKAPHAKGAIITHLADHGYGTLFPSAKLQGEMADRIGQLIHDSKIRRMSFDGMEGCFYTGNGEYGASEYVRRVFEKVGNELICDASGGTHYRWHAHSYFNWGEPWYDFQHRGGLENYRSRNQDYFRRNLIPGMLGWYIITNHRKQFEATMPETLEYILSRTVAHNAGLCITLDAVQNAKMDKYLELIKNWQEFNREVKLSDEIRNKMKDKHSNWHLEKQNGKWVLSELEVVEYHLAYCEKSLSMESGTTGYTDGKEVTLENGAYHKTTVVLDKSTSSEDIPPVDEPLHCRIRIGTPLNSFTLKNFGFSEGWLGPKEYIKFPVTAKAGDYLEYFGGKTLNHYDCDYNLIETVEGDGVEVMLYGNGINGISPSYETYGDCDTADIMLTNIRAIAKYTF